MKLPVRILSGGIFSCAAALSYGAALLAVSNLEAQTYQSIQAAYASQNINWVESQINGLNLKLSGTAPNEAELFNALTLATKIINRSQIDNEMTVAALPLLEPLPISLVMIATQETISMAGLLPEKFDKTELVMALKSRFEGRQVTNLLAVADQAVPDGWRSAQNFVLKALELMQNASITLTSSGLEIKATSTGPFEKERLIAALEAKKPDNLELSLELLTPRPALEAFEMRLIRKDSGTFLTTCSAETEADAEHILVAASNIGAVVHEPCEIGLGAPTRDWSSVAATAIQAAKPLKFVSISLRDQIMVVKGSKKTEPKRFAQVLATIRAALPKGFSLTAELPEPTTMIGPDVKLDTGHHFKFTTTLSPEGLVQMRGSVAGNLAYRTVKTYAQALFGLEKVYIAAFPDPQLGERWSTRTYLALDALAMLDRGMVTITQERFEISGATRHPDASLQVSELLRDALGPNADIEIDIAYIKPKHSAPVGPTPTECEARIAGILKAQKISFQPSSAEVEIEARQVIDQIATILKRCGPLNLEIGGHTDSQGREEMNQKLSQNRAQSVVNALLARRLSVATFSVVGYGETQPIADNGTEEGREANRRIEFRLSRPDTAGKPEQNAAATTTPKKGNKNDPN